MPANNENWKIIRAEDIDWDPNKLLDEVCKMTGCKRNESLKDQNIYIYNKDIYIKRINNK